jgi:hypothetical protein
MHTLILHPEWHHAYINKNAANLHYVSCIFIYFIHTSYITISLIHDIDLLNCDR